MTRSFKCGRCNAISPANSFSCASCGGTFEATALQRDMRALKGPIKYWEAHSYAQEEIRSAKNSRKVIQSLLPDPTPRGSDSTARTFALAAAIAIPAIFPFALVATFTLPFDIMFPFPRETIIVLAFAGALLLAAVIGFGTTVKHNRSLKRKLAENQAANAVIRRKNAEAETINKNMDKRIRESNTLIEQMHSAAVKAGAKRIPSEFQGDYNALRHLEHYITSGRADSLKEAMHLWDEELHRRSIEDAQERLVREHRAAREQQFIFRAWDQDDADRRQRRTEEAIRKSGERVANATAYAAYQADETFKREKQKDRDEFRRATRGWS